jgi:hypothetical protein
MLKILTSKIILKERVEIDRMSSRKLNKPNVCLLIDYNVFVKLAHQFLQQLYRILNNSERL